MKAKMNYKLSIISYFDILGFKNIVDNLEGPEIIRILVTFKTKSEPPKELKSLYQIKFTNFSDTIIRSTNIFSRTNKHDRDGLLWHELRDLIIIQYYLILRGVLIRGSVTIGQIYQTKDLIFGPGLNQAYKLEQDAAIYPRIIIDPAISVNLNTIPLLRHFDHTIEEAKEDIKGLIRMSSDGIWYLDYLHAMKSILHYSNKYSEFLRTHRYLIISESNKYCKSNSIDRISIKYCWLVNYHNEVVMSIDESFFEGQGDKRESFLISREDCPSFYDL